MKLKHLVMTGVLLIALYSITGWVNHHTPPDKTDLALMVLPPIPSGCDASCEDDEQTCSTPEQERHRYEEGFGAEGWENDGSGSHCGPGSCEAHFHEECEPTMLDEEDLDNLYVALNTLSGTDLQRLLAGNPERLAWNEKRLSVQLIGCEGRILASIPLSSTQAASLSSD